MAQRTASLSQVTSPTRAWLKSPLRCHTALTSVLCFSLILCVVQPHVVSARTLSAKSGRSYRIQPIRKARDGDTSTATPANATTDTKTHGSAQEHQVLPNSVAAASFQDWPGIPGRKAGAVQYHNGLLLTSSPLQVHVIFYGNWVQSEKDVLSGFVNSLSSPLPKAQVPSVNDWWRILSQYTDSQGAPVSPQVTLGKIVSFSRNYKKHLRDGISSSTDDIRGLVARSIRRGKLPLDTNAVYAVLTSGDVTVGDGKTGFCGAYCGWHTQTTVNGQSVQYAFIGDGSSQCDGCTETAGLSGTANGHIRIDGVMSAFAHELAEAASNPDTTTGYWALDQDGQTSWENADLCNGVLVDSNNPDLHFNQDHTYAYNLEGLDGRKFLVQANVDLSLQACVLQTGESASHVGEAAPPDIASPPEGGVAAGPETILGGGVAPTPIAVDIGEAPTSGEGCG